MKLNTIINTILNRARALFMATLVILSACSDPEEELAKAEPATSPSGLNNQLIFVNAVPGSVVLNFLANNSQVGGSASYGETTGAYIGIPAGNVQFRGKAATGSIGGTLGTSDVIYRASATNTNIFSTTSGFKYTIFVGDTLNRPKPTSPAGVTDPGGIRFVVYQDNLGSIAADKAHIRFVHLAPNAPSVYVTTGATTLFSNVAFVFKVAASGTTSGNRAITNNNFTAVTPGMYTLDVRTGAADGTIVLSKDIDLVAGKAYTIYAKGLVGSDATPLDAGVIQHN